MDQYDLVLGLPHTNFAGLADHLLLAYAGHFQWTSIARAIGKPLSHLRTLAGGEVYATFYFIEEEFPAGRPISSFRLDDALRFAVSLRAFKNMAVEGQIVFDIAERLAPTLAALGENAPGPEARSRHPYIRFGNIFITPEGGNSQLRVAPPANADFSGLPVLPNAENPYHLTKAAELSGELGLITNAWRPLDSRAESESRYQIDPDRDTNGAGLVYFANYIAFMEAAERRAIGDRVGPRALQRRRVAYYGNVSVDDAIRTRVSLFVHEDNADVLGIRYAVSREHDGRLICRSEAIKVLLPA
jgi:probable biosynthetic protein (TIGR04098 family)